MPARYSDPNRNRGLQCLLRVINLLQCQQRDAVIDRRLRQLRVLLERLRKALLGLLGKLLTHQRHAAIVQPNSLSIEARLRSGGNGHRHKNHGQSTANSHKLHSQARLQINRHIAHCNAVEPFSVCEPRTNTEQRLPRNSTRQMARPSFSSHTRTGNRERAMNTVYQPTATRHEYHIKAWYRSILLVLGAPAIAGSVVMCMLARDVANSALSLVMTAAFLFFGVYLIALALRSRVIIDGTRIEIRGAFTDRFADRNEIEGYRTISSRNSKYTQFYLNNGRGTLTLYNHFDQDGAFDAWIRKVPDLDKRDRDRILEKISQQEELGSTPQERLNALAQAKTYSIFALVIAIAAAVAANWGIPALYLLFSVALALVPIALAIPPPPLAAPLRGLQTKRRPTRRTSLRAHRQQLRIAHSCARHSLRLSSIGRRSHSPAHRRLYRRLLPLVL